MANPKSAMFDRISKLSKGAPLHEAGTASEVVLQASEALTESAAKAEQSTQNEKSVTRKKVKAVRRAKNVQIPEDLWDAYDQLKEQNITSLLMTPYILEAFREKLARDGAFDKK